MIYSKPFVEEFWKRDNLSYGFRFFFAFPIEDVNVCRCSFCTCVFKGMGKFSVKPKEKCPKPCVLGILTN